jgi:hypothetical protein
VVRFLVSLLMTCIHNRQGCNCGGGGSTTPCGSCAWPTTLHATVVYWIAPRTFTTYATVATTFTFGSGTFNSAPIYWTAGPGVFYGLIIRLTCASGLTPPSVIQSLFQTFTLGGALIPGTTSTEAWIPDTSNHTAYCAAVGPGAICVNAATTYTCSPVDFATRDWVCYSPGFAGVYDAGGGLGWNSQVGPLLSLVVTP